MTNGAQVHGRAAALSGSTLLVGCGLTVMLLTVPALRSGIEAPTLHVMLETCNAMVALLVGYLVLGRFRQSHRLQTLLLALALGTVAAANLVLTALPSAVLLDRAAEFGTGSPVAVRTLGAVLFFAAAVTPLASRVDSRRTVALAAVLGGLGVATAVASVLRDQGLVAGTGPSVIGGGGPLAGAPVVVVLAQGVAAVLLAAAAVAFTRQADSTGDGLIRWVAAGCVLGSLARVHYLISPSLDPGHVYSGDVLRLGGFLLMLVGAAREITALWQLRTQAAVVEDRRRMARDLHDGLTQELSYIWAQSQRLASHPGDTVIADRIRASADRAVDESRRAIAALTRADEGALADALERLADELARRYEVKIMVSAERGPDVDGALAEALLRITGEAVRNAVRHGAASRIDIELTTEPVSLTVTDDGRGFPAEGAGEALGGFGLTSMRERAAVVGGSLAISSSPGEGTTVRVAWS